MSDWMQAALVVLVSLGGALGALMLFRMIWVLIHPKDR